MWTAGNQLPIWDLFPLITNCTSGLIMLISITSSPLIQVVYNLAVFIVFAIVSVVLQECVRVSPRHFCVAQGSVVAVAVCQGFLSYYVIYLPGTRGVEMFAMGMVLLASVGFLGGAGYALLSNWMVIKPAGGTNHTNPALVYREKSLGTVPPNNSMQESSILS
jgi:hypothetical protein